MVENALMETGLWFLGEKGRLVSRMSGARQWGLSLASADIFLEIWPRLKTTIDLPDALFHRTKVAAAQRRTTIKNLVIQGLEAVLKEEKLAAPPAGALARLRKGYHFTGRLLTREETHER